MKIPEVVSRMMERADNVNGNITLLSTPYESQKEELAAEEWTIHFVSGSSAYDYAAHRDFKARIEEASNGTAKVLSYPMENLTAAFELVEAIQDALPAEAQNNLIVEDIRDQSFDDNDPVYVEIVVRTIFKRR